MDNREPVKVATLEEFIKNRNFAHDEAEEPQDKPGKHRNRCIRISGISGQQVLPGICLGHVD